MEGLVHLSVALLLYAASSSAAGPLWEAIHPKEFPLENELDLNLNQLDEPGIPNEQKKFIFKQHQPRIMGGSRAKEGEFPWQVSLQNGAGDHFCGGSILDTTHIITAAHCIVGETPSKTLVVAGAHNMKDRSEQNQQRIRPKKMVGHPKYNGNTIDFDIAIIELNRPLVFNKRVRPIRLPPPNHEPSGQCVTSGWGNANPFGFGSHVTPSYLKKLTTSIVSRNLCRIPYLLGDFSWLSENMLCGGNGLISGTCDGDSGGPLICYDLPNDPKAYLAGLTSWGVPPCHNLLFPTVYTNVANQRNFIDKELNAAKMIPNIPTKPILDTPTKPIQNTPTKPIQNAHTQPIHAPYPNTPLGTCGSLSECIKNQSTPILNK